MIATIFFPSLFASHNIICTTGISVLQKDHSDPTGHKSQTRAEVKQHLLPCKASMRFLRPAHLPVQQMEMLMADIFSFKYKIIDL